MGSPDRLAALQPGDPPLQLDVPLARAGESMRWHADHACLYYCDIHGQELRRYDPATGDHRAWAFDEPVGAWIPTDGPRLLLGIGGTFWLFDPESGACERYVIITKDPDLRINDSRCDGSGRLWTSTMTRHGPPQPPVGSLYRVEAKRNLAAKVTEVSSALSIPNTLAWNLDGSTMYFSDSLERRVHRYPYEQATGVTGPREEFFALDSDRPGIPDGACLDEEGALWIAIARGSRVERRQPDGCLDMEVEMPAKRPTMCGFGGPNLDLLFVTSLRPPDSVNPADGGLFALRPGIRGRAEAIFALQTER